jgi:hypothetical protein
MPRSNSFVEPRDSTEVCDARLEEYAELPKLVEATRASR